MADFKIKSAAGTGNKILIQSENQTDSNYAIEIGASGASTLHNAAIKTTGAMVKHQKVLTVISSAVALTNTYADVTGSSITYTPATGASYIVYECSFVRSADSSEGSALQGFRFMIDGTITKNQDSYAPYERGSDALWTAERIGHKMIYSASGWTSDKVVKMQARGNGSSNNGQLFSNFYDYLSADGGDFGGTDRLTDVITTIYSVM